MSLTTRIQPLRDESLKLVDASQYSVAIIRTEADWGFLEADWKRVFSRSANASPPMGWDWAQTWWGVYGARYSERVGKDEGLRIFVVKREGFVVAILPLYLRRPQSAPFGSRRLCFISTGEAEFEEVCAEHLDLICLPEEREVASKLLRDTILNAKSGDWDEFWLSPISVNSILYSWTQSGEPLDSKFEITTMGPSFIADISGGFEAYLGRISANSRGLARKRTRGALRDGAKFEIARTPEEVEEMWGELIPLHQARWEAEGKPGCFSAPRFTEFHRSLLMKLLSSGEGILARLSIEGEPLAVMLGYIAGTKFDSYVAGAKFEDDRVKSPGITLHLLLKEMLSLQGIELYDHMSGTMRYKQQYSTEEVETVRLIVKRPTLRTQVNRVSEAALKAARKGKRLFGGAGKNETPEKGSAVAPAE